jgi:MYXO-CTERM domain-containing protein
MLLRRLIGFVLLAFALLLLALKLLALADPVGTKMADDGDPFGDPHQPWWVHAIYFAAVALLVAAGVRLIRRRAAHPLPDGR